MDDCLAPYPCTQHCNPCKYVPQTVETELGLKHAHVGCKFKTGTFQLRGAAPRQAACGAIEAPFQSDVDHTHTHTHTMANLEGSIFGIGNPLLDIMVDAHDTDFEKYGGTRDPFSPPFPLLSATVNFSFQEFGVVISVSLSDDTCSL